MIINYQFGVGVAIADEALGVGDALEEADDVADIDIRQRAVGGGGQQRAHRHEEAVGDGLLVLGRHEREVAEEGAQVHAQLRVLLCRRVVPQQEQARQQLRRCQLVAVQQFRYAHGDGFHDGSGLTTMMILSID